jgi:hypothetical protein
MARSSRELGVVLADDDEEDRDIETTRRSLTKMLDSLSDKGGLTDEELIEKVRALYIVYIYNFLYIIYLYIIKIIYTFWRYNLSPCS